MFTEEFDYDDEYFKKRWNPDTYQLIVPLIDLFKNTVDFNHENLHTITKNYVDSIGKKLGELIHPIRLMITGKSTGSGMFETMEVLGKEVCIGRFEKFLNKVQKSN